MLCLKMPLALGVEAQTGQYVAPGSLALSQKSAAEAVREGAEKAKWKVGPLRIEPRFSLRNVGYDDNVFAVADEEERVSDTHAALGVGLAAYSKLGPKVYLSTFIAPEYTWWQNLDEFNELSVNYGAGAFGFFNRLQFGLQVSSTERERLLSSEAEIPVQALEDRIVAEARIDLRPRLAVECRITTAEFRYGDSVLLQRPDLLVAELESDTDRTEALLAMTFRGGLEMALGIEDHETEFLLDPGGRSNSGTSPVVRILYDSSRLRLEGRFVSQSTTFDSAELANFDETTGTMLLEIQLGQQTSASIYGGRNLVFGLQGLESTIEDSRWGLAVGRQFGERVTGRLYGETGSSDFQDQGGPNAGRQDDLQAYGLETQFQVTGLLGIRVRFWQVDYDSNLPQFNRSTTRFGIGIDLSEGLLPW